MSEYEERTPRPQRSETPRGSGAGGAVPRQSGGSAPNARQDRPGQQQRPPAARTGQKRRRRRRRSLGILGAVLYVVAVVGVSALLAVLGWHWAGDVLALNKPEHSAVITLSDDVFTYETTTNADGKTVRISRADMDYVAKTLAENELIENEWLFRLFSAFTHGDRELAPGTYTLNTTMDYRAIIKNMSARSTTKTEVTVLIPEGSTVEQIFEILEKNGVCTAAKLREASAEYDFKFSFLQNVVPLGDENRLEGYLFPDTYIFYKNSDAVTVLNKMLLRFDEVFTDEMREKAAENGQSVRDIVIIASLIEKETTGYDQTNISSVIHNRLYRQNSETNGRLDIDATIQYILPERKEKLTAEDTAIDSPYNTYLYPGLPIGPIASPGQASLRAALNPADTEYYFYAMGDDGEHHFFKTHAGQQEFIATQALYNNG